MYEIWVRDLKFVLNKQIIRKVSVKSQDTIVTSLCWQEDDIDGEHIVAFAEEDDPGTPAPLHTQLQHQHWARHIIIPDLWTLP